MPLSFFELFDVSLVDTYLRQCRMRNHLVEDESAHVPPTPEEVKELIAYLRGLKLRPAIVGSVGILRHIGTDKANAFRPTGDLDVWISSKTVPAPPRGWHQDRESIGVISWISPSGGYVDFMTPGHEYEGGSKNPASIDYDLDSEKSDYPIAHWKTLLKMKLNTMREKDLADCIALVRKIGSVPTEKELGKLNTQQKENLNLVTMWFAARPHGKYGE